MAGTAADRNLLLGIIALQMDFITRDALIAAMSAWVLKKETTLSQILEEHGTRHNPTWPFGRACRRAHPGPRRGRPEEPGGESSSIGSVHNDLNHIVDTEVRASLPLVAAARGDEDTDPYQTVPRTSVGESSSIGTRFRVLRPHARGGLGQVSVALDQELDRRVALKEIQERHADDLTSRAGSFRRPKSPASSNTRASFRSTASGTTRPAGRSTRCGSSRATAWAKPSRRSTATRRRRTETPTTPACGNCSGVSPTYATRSRTHIVAACCTGI